MKKTQNQEAIIVSGEDKGRWGQVLWAHEGLYLFTHVNPNTGDYWNEDLGWVNSKYIVFA